LGIAPTDDRRAIRSAYAARLKAIDPEEDPKAFIALREAMEQALAGALQLPRARSAASEPEPEAQPIGPSEIASMLDDPRFLLEDDMGILLKLVENPDWNDNAVAQRERLQMILRNPALDNPDIAAKLERWLIDMIADALPASDPLIEPAIETFHWKPVFGKAAPDEAMLAILARARDLDALRKLLDPDHPLHHAYLMLQQPPETVPRRKRRKAEADLRTLLRMLREQYRTLEWHFGWDRLNAWVIDIERPRRSLIPFSGPTRPWPVYRR
jgi:hypothetical protein